MAGVQAVSFQSAITKCLMNCGIQHPSLSSSLRFPAPAPSPGCSGNLQHQNRWLWQTDSLTLLWGRILKEIKMSNVPALHFTQSNRPGQGSPIGQPWMADWMTDRRGRPQSAVLLPKSRGSNRGDCCRHLSPSRASALPMTSPPLTKRLREEALMAFLIAHCLVKGLYHCLEPFSWMSHKMIHDSSNAVFCLKSTSLTKKRLNSFLFLH